MSEVNSTVSVDPAVGLPPLPVVEGVEIRHCPGHRGYAIGSDGSPYSCWHGPIGICKQWHRNAAIPTGKYGHLYTSLGNTSTGNSTLYAISRLVLEAFEGPCPDGYEACHDPDPTPANCNRNNLHWGTRQSNVDDKVRHGRSLRGQKHPGVLLTNAEVMEIYSYKGQQASKELAERFHVSRNTISGIHTGRSWWWLTGEPQRKWRKASAATAPG